MIDNSDEMQKGDILKWDDIFKLRKKVPGCEVITVGDIFERLKIDNNVFSDLQR